MVDQGSGSRGQKQNQGQGQGQNQGSESGSGSGVTHHGEDLGLDVLILLAVRVRHVDRRGDVDDLQRRLVRAVLLVVKAGCKTQVNRAQVTGTLTVRRSKQRGAWFSYR